MSTARYDKMREMYVVCKNKYEILKEKLDMCTFINRSNGTPLSELHSMLFNMYLVKKNARSSYLLEFANYEYKRIRRDLFLEQIKKIYSEFTYTVEYYVKDIIDGESVSLPHRVFVHIKPLTNYETNHDVWVAKNLDFVCRGIPSEDLLRVTINYYVNTNIDRFSFYTEICTKDNYDINKKRFDDRHKLFNKYASLMDWVVEMQIDELITIQYIIDMVLKDKLPKRHEPELMNAIYYNQKQGENIFTYEELMKNKNMLLFCYCCRNMIQ